MSYPYSSHWFPIKNKNRGLSMVCSEKTSFTARSLWSMMIRSSLPITLMANWGKLAKKDPSETGMSMTCSNYVSPTKFTTYPIGWAMSSLRPSSKVVYKAIINFNPSTTSSKTISNSMDILTCSLKINQLGFWFIGEK